MDNENKETDVCDKKKELKREIDIKRKALLSYAQENIKEYMKVQGYKVLVADEKNYLLKGKLIETNISLDQNDVLSEAEKRCCRTIFKSLVINGLKMSPQEFEEVVNVDFLNRVKLGRLANMVFNSASPQELRDGRYNKTTTILCACFPDYYYRTRRRTVSLMEIFDAPQDLISNMSAIGKSKKSETSRETKNMGKLIDDIIYEAWAEKLPSILPGIGGGRDERGNTSDNSVTYTPDERLEAFIELDKPKSMISSKGSAKIIKNRKNFQTYLDFYFLKSPAEYQKENLHLYYIAKLVTGSLYKNPMALKMFDYEKRTNRVLKFYLDTKIVEQLKQRHFPAPKTRLVRERKKKEETVKEAPVAVPVKEENPSMDLELE